MEIHHWLDGTELHRVTWWMKRNADQTKTTSYHSPVSCSLIVGSHLNFKEDRDLNHHHHKLCEAGTMTTINHTSPFFDRAWLESRKVVAVICFSNVQADDSIAVGWERATDRGIYTCHLVSGNIISKQECVTKGCFDGLVQWVIEYLHWWHADTVECWRYWMLRHN